MQTDINDTFLFSCKWLIHYFFSYLNLYHRVCLTTLDSCIDCNTESSWKQDSRHVTPNLLRYWVIAYFGSRIKTFPKVEKLWAENWIMILRKKRILVGDRKFNRRSQSKRRKWTGRDSKRFRKKNKQLHDKWNLQTYLQLIISTNFFSTCSVFSKVNEKNGSDFEPDAMSSFQKS